MDRTSVRLVSVFSVFLLTFCIMGSAVYLSDDSSAATGSASNPLSSFSGDMVDYVDSTVYVKVGGTVRVTTDSSVFVEVQSVTSGYGLSCSGGTCSGTLSKAGTITVYGIDENWEDCTMTIVSVNTSTPVTSITISGSSSVTKGSTLTLTATTSPTSADDRHVTWSIQSGSSYISITSTSDTTTGGRCVINGVAAGTAVIKATAADGSGVTKTKTITVSNPSYNYNLYYDANGGSGEPSTQTKTSTSTSSTLSFTVSSTEPTRSGYNFLGWSTSSTATSASYTGGDTVRVTYDDLTLYAVWEKITYTCKLQYNANGGSGAPTTQTYTGSSTSSHSFTVSSTVPVRDGYTFLGWSTSSSATAASYVGGNSISVSYNGTTTLYAVWEKNEPVLVWTTSPSQDCIKLPTIVYADDGTYTIQGVSA